jgi:rhamnose utilization protein RhaD (predicted bifunctional aldolase and dehydrogenase)
MESNYFEYIVDTLGFRQDYFPGTGGNISLKLESGSMLIKASGKRILHMKESDGVVPLEYEVIKEYFHTTPHHSDGDKESTELILKTLETQATGRPSIETGFHALLSLAVIHSHSAYVNFITCSTSFESIMDTIFLGSSIPYLCIGYAKPGYHLTHLFLDKVRRLSHRPKVIFMKSHGVVVSAQTLEEAVKLHEEVNIAVQNYFRVSPTEYPKGVLFHENEGRSVSRTPLLREFVKDNIHIFENINQYILFPDLTVFCQDIVVADSSTAVGKIVIVRSTGEVIYNTNKKEAHCIEENLIAFAFIMMRMKEHNLRPVYISEEEADSIRNMEQEKYRKRLLEVG